MSTKRIIGPDWKPPVGGYILDWERVTGTRKSGWIAFDWNGNAVGFMADGDTWEVKETEVKPV